MNPLQRTLISKTGFEYDFEFISAERTSGLTLAAARHHAIIEVRWLAREHEPYLQYHRQRFEAST